MIDHLINFAKNNRWFLMAYSAESPSPPSVAFEFLVSLVGVKVVDLVRYSWWPADEVSAECKVQAEQSFALTAGPLVIVFENGSILGLGSDPSKKSVIVWGEGADFYKFSDTALDQDDELFPISAKDDCYAAPFWRGVIGSALGGLTILKPVVINAKERNLPCEVGLRFQLQNGLSFIASHGLHDGSDDFSVLEESQLAPMDFEELMKI